MQIGYALSSEEHAPGHLVRFAGRAEAVGFDFAMISDHFHPWVDRQGESPFVWGVLGAIAGATTRLRVGTGVTCPIMRIHPAIIAQAAATAAALLPGRFFLGVGAGENLNEHVLGDHWPEGAIRLEMLEEAIEVIRLLWGGEQQSHYGHYFTVEQARIYTRPEVPPEIYVAADGEGAAALAARAGDGLIGTAPDKDLVRQFTSVAGKRKPRIGQFAVCYAGREAEARQIAREWWPNAGLEGRLSWELKTPALIEQATKQVSEARIAEAIVCGPDPDRHLERFRLYADAGYDHIYVHQIGPDQEGFFRFYEDRILPALR